MAWTNGLSSDFIFQKLSGQRSGSPGSLSVSLWTYASTTDGQCGQCRTVAKSRASIWAFLLLALWI